SPTAPPRSGDTTPQVIRSTGGTSHAGPGGQRPHCRTAKKITGGAARDTFGSYDVVWYASGALCAAAALMALVIRRRPEPALTPTAA
ncbi:hypothetical protein RM705_22625, partial [Streptomyces sp. DSM 41636]|nr:hypothetical protein [Streptomyces sp. DSM 41636]